MAVLKGSWKYVKVVCGNHGDCHDIDMEIQQGPHSLFYACPKYYPENRSGGEPPCMNRINLIEYEKMLSDIAEVMIQAEMKGEVANLTNYNWEKKGIEYQILSHNDEKLVVKALNKKALMQ